MRPQHVFSVVATATLAATLLVVPPTAAAPDSGSAARPLARGLLTPLSFAVRGNGTAFISQNFAGLLMKQRPGRKAKVVFSAPRKNTEVGAVSLDHGVVTFATTRGRQGIVWTMNRRGKVRELGDVGAHERNDNPDGGVTYGARDLTEECAAQWPVDELGPPTYPAIKETHPYATTTAGDMTYVADAAGNAIVGVAPDGTVSTVALMPAIPIVITAEAATAFGLPECAVGETYWFEPVPTDVNMGRDGMLYVTSLPGGPEDDTLGANGSVFRVDPATGDATKVAGGLAGAVNLAVAGNGDIYVAELFGNRISRIPAGSDTAEHFRSVQQPGAVQVRSSHLYATTKVLTGLSGAPGDRPKGKLVQFSR